MQWDKIAEDLWQLSLSGNVSLLQKMSKEIMDIYCQEKNLYQSLQKILTKGGFFYGLHRSKQRTYRVFFQCLLQSCHTLCRYQRMA